MNYFFTSDNHRGHRNIIHLCSRPFPDTLTMDRALEDNHNAVVTDNDTIYFLGDYAYRCSAEYATEGLKRLRGHINMILGNHDKPIRQAYHKGLLKDMISSGKLTIIGSLDPTEATIKTVTVNGVTIVLSHYALRTWPHAFRAAIHLFGHSHGKLSPHYRSFDCGVDANNYFPMNFEQIMEKMSKLSPVFSEK